MTEQATTAPAPIVARAGTYYRVTRYLLCAVFLLYGVWSIYDGFVSWPAWPQTHPHEKPYTQTDIYFNRVIGVVFPILSIALLIRSLHNSRGEYRLEDGVVHIPGHPPVPLDKISGINKTLWDRKGIAHFDYNVGQVPAGSKLSPRGTFRLDDFVYERDATDAIYKILDETLTKNTAAKVAANAAQNKVRLPPRPRMGPGL
jgi:hypothetical protein